MITVHSKGRTPVPTSGWSEVGQTFTFRPLNECRLFKCRSGPIAYVSGVPNQEVGWTKGRSAVMSSWDHGRQHPNLLESLILLGAFLHAACPCRGSGQRRRILDLSASERRSCGPPSGDTPGCIRRTGRQRREASITASSLTCCHPSNATPIRETRPTSLEGSPLL